MRAALNDGGGGLFSDGSAIVLTSNTFINNSTASIGGAMYIYSPSQSTLESNTIIGNTSTVVSWANQGAGGVYISGAAILSNNSVTNNSTRSSGGGIYASGTITLSNNIIQGNSADMSGGGVYVYADFATLNNNSIISNTATSSGGGVNFANGTGIVATNGNSILGNTANGSGGGIAIAGGIVNAKNDIVGRNSAPWEGVYLSGGLMSAKHWTLVNNGKYALNNNGGTVIITNTIVATHTLAGLNGMGVLGDHTLFFGNSTNCTPGVTCTNNFSGDPKFVNPSAQNYHISPSSAAIDQGINAGIITDIDGEPRPMGSGYDIGADEINPLYAIVNPLGSWQNSLSFPVTWAGQTSGGFTITGYDVQYRDGLNGTWIDWLVNTPATSSNFSGQDSHTYFFRARARDSGGNIGTFSGTVQTTVDVTAPAIGSFNINNASQYSASPNVTLYISATDSLSGISAMSFSNDGSNWNIWQSNSITSSWTLSNGDGTKTVYARVKDQASNISSPVSDTIILDTTPPIGSIMINGGANFTASSVVTLTLNASDAVSGVAQMRFSGDGFGWWQWENYTTTKTVTLASGDGTYAVICSIQGHRRECLHDDFCDHHT
jgi:predicted outer membrane repeat protein